MKVPKTFLVEPTDYEVRRFNSMIVEYLETCTAATTAAVTLHMRKACGHSKPHPSGVGWHEDKRATKEFLRRLKKDGIVGGIGNDWFLLHRKKMQRLVDDILAGRS